jgi:hypothetical protein
LFDSTRYGDAVQRILGLDGDGLRPMPLEGGDAPETALKALGGTSAGRLFAGSYSPDAAMGGLWLYYSQLEEAHAIVQNVPTQEGSFWHGILHRREPDAGNAAYWFRRVGRHACFPALAEAAAVIVERYAGLKFVVQPEWDPFGFIYFCEQARRDPGSAAMRAATEIQLAEWQLLFDFCARRLD